MPPEKRTDTGPRAPPPRRTQPCSSTRQGEANRAPDEFPTRTQPPARRPSRSTPTLDRSSPTRSQPLPFEAIEGDSRDRLQSMNIAPARPFEHTISLPDSRPALTASVSAHPGGLALTGMGAHLAGQSRAIGHSEGPKRRLKDRIPVDKGPISTRNGPDFGSRRIALRHRASSKDLFGEGGQSRQDRPSGAAGAFTLNLTASQSCRQARLPTLFLRLAQIREQAPNGTCCGVGLSVWLLADSGVVPRIPPGHRRVSPQRTQRTQNWTEERALTACLLSVFSASSVVKVFDSSDHPGVHHEPNG